MDLVSAETKGKSKTAEDTAAAGERARNLPDLADVIDEDRPSITEVNGTVARFDMSFAPDKPLRRTFIAPMKARVPSLVYLAFAFVVAGIVLAAYNGSSSSRLFVWIVEGDRNRPLGAQPLSILIMVSALGTVLRSWMRGVIVTNEGIETREVLMFGMPRLKRWAWPQIDRLVLDDRGVMLELWNGQYERLPAVHDQKALSDLLEAVAANRELQVTRLKELA
jgi:hypothetical protein